MSRRGYHQRKHERTNSSGTTFPAGQGSALLLQQKPQTKVETQQAPVVIPQMRVVQRPLVRAQIRKPAKYKIGSKILATPSLDENQRRIHEAIEAEPASALEDTSSSLIQEFLPEAYKKASKKKMSQFEMMMAWESGELSDADTVRLFQMLVDSGQAWTLQGTYVRTAESLILSGYVTSKRNLIGIPKDIEPQEVSEEDAESFVDASVAEKRKMLHEAVEKFYENHEVQENIFQEIADAIQYTVLSKAALWEVYDPQTQKASGKIMLDPGDFLFPGKLFKTLNHSLEFYNLTKEGFALKINVADPQQTDLRRYMPDERFKERTHWLYFLTAAPSGFKRDWYYGGVVRE